MAEQVFTKAYAMINSVDLSDHVRSLTINYSADSLDKSASGDLTRSKIAGLMDWSVTIEFNQDYAAGEVDATLYPLVGAAEFAVVFRPSTDAIGVTNPSFSGNAILTAYPPISNSHGELATTSVTLEGSGTLTRATD